MKKLLLFCSIFFFGNQLLQSQTTLVVGDIVIVGYNADEVGNEDEFSFIPLKDLAAGAVINFTDFGWTSESNGFQLSCIVANTSGAVADGAITWTAPAGGVLFGQQVHIVCGGASLSASHGTVVGLQATANSITNGPTIEYMSLSPGGDQIFAFQGTLGSPTLITALGMNGAWDATLTNCEFTSSKSVFPSALNGTNSLAITPEVDNATYNCSVTTGTASVLRTAILNVANWDVNNDTPFTLPIPCFGSTLGIEDFENKSNFLIYPNPTSGLLNINTDFDAQLIILNQLGQTVKEFNVYSTITNVINIENLANGIYYVKSMNGNQINFQNLVIKK